MMNQAYQSAQPNLSTVIFAGLEEIIGSAGLDELGARPAEETAQACASKWMASFGRLEARFGRNGAQGVALRAGRASFHYWLRQFGETLHLAQLEYRLKPAAQRLRFGFEAIAQTLQSQWGLDIEVVEDDLCWRWRLADCSGYHPSEYSTCCSYLAGFLQEYLSWISGGKYFPVSLSQPVEQGQPICEVTLRKQPLD